MATNNTINNLNMPVFDKKQDDIKEIVYENYDKNYLADGQKGVARFTHAYILKNKDETKPPMYVVTDKSRGNGKYRISDTEVVTDIGMAGLTKKVHPSIKEKASIIISSEDNIFDNKRLLDGFQEVYKMQDDNSIFRREIVVLLA